MDPLHFALLLALAQDAPPDETPEPPRAAAPNDPAPSIAELLEDELSAQDSAVSVKLVSAEGMLPLFDVVAHDAPAHEVLARLAKAIGKEISLDEGETVLRAGTMIDVQLRKRPLTEIVEWVTGSAGLAADIGRSTIRCRADTERSTAPERALEHAIDSWRTALLRNPDSVEVPRLRFQIGNAYFQLGRFAEAIQIWENEIEAAADASTFGDLSLVYYRCGFAHARLGDEKGAQSQWFSIATNFSGDPLIAPARLEVVRSLRREGDTKNANVALRLVIEGMKDGLTPHDLVDAGELLAEGGDPARAIATFQWALQGEITPGLSERALASLMRAQNAHGDIHDVVQTAKRYLDLHRDGPNAAEIYLQLGLAHAKLDDPFTALLALRRSRELAPGGESGFRCDVAEGELFIACGLADRAEPLFARASACEFPMVAAMALVDQIALQRGAGQLEAAARGCERLSSLPGHEVSGALALAEIYLLQHSRTRAVELIQKTLPLADDAQRSALLELADRALRGGGTEAAAGLFAPPAATETHDVPKEVPKEEGSR